MHLFIYCSVLRDRILHEFIFLHDVNIMHPPFQTPFDV